MGTLQDQSGFHDETLPCDIIRKAFATDSDCNSYEGTWNVFGDKGLLQNGLCTSSADCRRWFGYVPILLEETWEQMESRSTCYDLDECVRLQGSFTQIRDSTSATGKQACMLCQQRCSCESSLLPYSLQPFCSDRSLANNFTAASFYDWKQDMWTNGHLTGFSMCVTNGIGELQLAAQALMCLPSITLILWLTICLTLPWISGDVLVSQWSVPPDMELQSAVRGRARQLCRQMRRGEMETKPADKVFFYMDFGLFLMDYVTDWVSMILNFVNLEFGPAIVQGVIILLPVALDCYKGKIQLVEAVGGFVRSRKKGYPTNAYIKALRSEKSVEAPLSLCLQYYSVLRLTSAFSFWVALVSMSLSIWSLAKFCFVTFELGVTDEAAEELTADAVEGMPEPHQPAPPMPMHMPQRPPGIAPPNKGPAAPSMPKPHRDAFPDRPPGVAPPNQSPGSFPERPPGVAPPNQDQIQAAGLNLEMLCVGDESFHVHNFQLLRETQQNTRIRVFSEHTPRQWFPLHAAWWLRLTSRCQRQIRRSRRRHRRTASFCQSLWATKRWLTENEEPLWAIRP